MINVWSAVAGGAIAGAAAGIVLLANGRIAGVTGMLSEALRPRGKDASWQLVYLLGLISGGALLAQFLPSAMPMGAVGPEGLLIGAGLLVGFGARLSGGCTSGHGLCGVGRLSFRSTVATVTFMASGAVTVWILRHVLRAL